MSLKPMNKPAIWKHVVRYDIYGKPVFVNREIRCNYTSRAQAVRTLEGDTINSRAFIALKERVLPGDVVKIDGINHSVQGTVKSINDLAGNVLWYEVVV